MKRKLTKEEASRIHNDGLDLSDRHLQIRVLEQLDLHKVKKVFEEGET